MNRFIAKKSAPANEAGFTLIELMIALVILSILAAIAFPTYQNSIIKSRRSDATGALSQGSLAMETCRANGSTYTGCAPVANSQAGYYTIAVNVPAGGASFTLTASPVAGTTQANDADCTTLTLTSGGVRGYTGSASGASICWGS